MRSQGLHHREATRNRRRIFRETDRGLHHAATVSAAK
jgi:hypothetical protein